MNTATDESSVVATIEQVKPPRRAPRKTAKPNTNDSTTIMSIIMQVATNPSADLDKMERLMQMHERHQVKQAKQAFDDALSQMQSELPVVYERGAILNKQGAVQSTYALWEDINEQLRPTLSKHGFAITFRIPRNERGVEVEGVLSHKDGHRESTSILLPADTSGSKNGVQAVASSVSYGKRYTAGALLNFTTTGEDDDGQRAGQPAISDQTESPTKPTLEPYPEKNLTEGLPLWRKAFDEERSSPEHVIAMISSKYTLSQEQITTIRNLMPIAGESA